MSLARAVRARQQREQRRTDRRHKREQQRRDRAAIVSTAVRAAEHRMTLDALASIEARGQYRSHWPGDEMRGVDIERARRDEASEIEAAEADRRRLRQRQ